MRRVRAWMTLCPRHAMPSQPRHLPSAFNANSPTTRKSLAPVIASLLQLQLRGPRSRCPCCGEGLSLKVQGLAVSLLGRYRTGLADHCRLGSFHRALLVTLTVTRHCSVQACICGVTRLPRFTIVFTCLMLSAFLVFLFSYVHTLLYQPAGDTL